MLIPALFSIVITTWPYRLTPQSSLRSLRGRRPGLGTLSTRPYRLTARTVPFQGANPGSIPGGVTMRISPISASAISALLEVVGDDRKVSFPLALANTATMQEYFRNFSGTSDDFVLTKYDRGEALVTDGHITEKILQTDSRFSYSHVPLGFIVKGEIIVIKGGKATKRLAEGDFIGLFETSDWLSTHKNRNIGDWTLIAHTDTEVLFFSDRALQEEDAASELLRDYLVNIARSDKVPQPLTNLPLLDWAASHTTRSRLPDYAVIAHTHLLPNNFPFFRHLAHLVGFGRMYVLEKPYSTVPRVRNDLVESGCEVVQVRMEPGMPYEFAVQKSLEILWAKVIEEQRKSGFKKLLIIDDGGDVWLSIPWRHLEGVSLTGVEQTQRGISRIADSYHRIPPIVSVASSGTKKVVESQFIGKAVIDKLHELNLLAKQHVGILGTGSIGTAAIRALEKLNIQTRVYDPTQHQRTQEDLQASPSLDSLINDSDVIVGTTGIDALRGAAFDRMRGRKILVSASSADVEFASLLKLAPPIDTPFGTRHVEVHADLSFGILNGGYPINFDRVKDATPDEDIVLTRCLMYVGAMQAVALLESGSHENKIYALDTVAQKKILERWIQEKSLTKNSPVTLEEVDPIVAQNTSAFETGPTVWQ